MANEAEKILSHFLNRLQRNERIRKSLAIGIVALLLGSIIYFVYDIMPRRYALSITGGNILGNRHYLAKVLQDEGAKNGLSLKIVPGVGSQEELEQVEQGKLDLAFIQGGLDNHYPHVVHVATVASELLHVLVRSGVNDISGLKGKLVNLSSRKSGTRIAAQKVLEFSGLTEGIDYTESNFSSEDLITMHPDKLPDAVMMIAFPPSEVVEFLVKERGYQVLEIPFPASLALRWGWVADSKILAYTYNVKPPVPATDIKTVGVNMHLVANQNVDPRAVFKVLENLFNPAIEIRLRMKFDESQLTAPSGFHLSEGTKMFLARKNPIFSAENFDKIKTIFGLVLSVFSTLLVILKWFKGEPVEVGVEESN